MHRAAAAEMLYVLEPSNKDKAVKLIEDSINNLVQRYCLVQRSSLPSSYNSFVLDCFMLPSPSVEHVHAMLDRNGVLGSIGEWKLKDCIAVHKLLSSVVVDLDAASSKF